MSLSVESTRVGSNRVVGRQKRRNQQDDQQAANEDGGNLSARWTAEIQINDARLVISHRKQHYGRMGLTLEQ